MRLNISPYSDHCDAELCRRARVFLDGELISGVTEFDSQADWLVCHEMDAAGNIQYDPVAGAVKTCTMRGEVTFEFIPIYHKSEPRKAVL